MRAQIARWGGSLAVRLPPQAVEAAGLAAGAIVELDVVGHVLRLVPVRPSYTLDELLAGIMPENLPDEVFDDSPRGQELP